MGVQFTADAEKERLAARKRRWELLTTTSIVQALHFARDNGWKEKKVQVRSVQIDDQVVEYTVEPFEQDCSCPNILKYTDYFD